MRSHFRFQISNFRFKYALIPWLFIFVCTIHAEETPRSAMGKGLKFYKAGDYTNAVEMLEKTALEFPDIGNYNLGNAHYRLGDFEEAEKAYNEALRSEDVALQSKAYFNRGNAMLARTTALSGPEQIDTATELCFQAMDMFEKALLLTPDDLEAKQNFERAHNLRHKLEFNKGKWLFDHAESLLEEQKAKDAKKFYLDAKKQFEHILYNIDRKDRESYQYLPKIKDRLEMLDQAVALTEHDLKMARQAITEFKYMEAAKRLNVTNINRVYAFDLKPDLKKQYEETIQKNQEVLKIIEETSSLSL